MHRGSTNQCNARRRQGGDPLCSRLPETRACQMFTAEQYRAKAAEFRAFLTNIPRSPNETREFCDLEQIYTTLAENEEWMAVHIDRTIQRRKNYDNRTALVEEEDQILKCLGAAVLRCCRDLCWNWVTRSPAFREYRVRPRGQLADRWMFWQASANRQPFAC
jgi:hypothetical protein